MTMVLSKLSDFGSEDQLRDWKNELIGRVQDYTNREEIDSWYESLKNQYERKLKANTTCFKQVGLHVAKMDRLPLFGTQPNNICWCTRWVTKYNLIFAASIVASQQQLLAIAFL